MRLLMPVPLVCPFCRHTFALPELPPARRTPCPNCGESVPADQPSTATPAAPVASNAPPSGGMVFLSLGLTALIAAGFAVWWFVFRTPPPPPASPSTSITDIPATLPPPALPGLKYLPKTAHLLAAVQPSAVWQYAERTGQDPDSLLAAFGVPKELLTQLRTAGVPPERIQCVAAAANVDDLDLVLVISLREPLKDEGRFREKLKVQGSPPRAELAGVPIALLMAQPDDKTYLFALTERGLAGAKKPHDGLADFHDGLRESVGQVGPAAFAWAASDAKEWDKVPLLKLPAVPSVVAGKLAGVRAGAAGLGLGPDLQLTLALRGDSGTAAASFADGMKSKLADLKPEVTAIGEWATAVVPLHPPDETLPKLKGLPR